MATIIRALRGSYHYINVEVADPRTQTWFLIGSPWPGLALLISYIYFVQSLGPRLMKDRPPFNLDRVMQIYNVVQIVLSGYLLYKSLSASIFEFGGLKQSQKAENGYTGVTFERLNPQASGALVLAWIWDYSYFCEPVDYSNTPKAVEIAATVWLYFCVKIIDLLDTIFFVLRKKNNQISFLHVYHHTGMVVGTWGGVKYLPGGHGTFLGLINSFVHVIMYGHYFATSLKISRPWWKKYITQLQLLQFFLILLHFMQLVWTKDCGYPRWPALIFVPQNLFMIVLFGDFYYKTYIKKPSAAKTVGQNGVSKIANPASKTN